MAGPGNQRQGVALTPYRSMTSFYWTWSYKNTTYKDAKDQVLLGQTGLVGIADLDVFRANGA